MALIVHRKPVKVNTGGTGGTGGGSAGVTDHEKLSSLYGGDAEGHYHLTRDEWTGLKKILAEGGKPPEPDEPKEYDGGNASTKADDFKRELDGGFAPESKRTVVDGGERGRKGPKRLRLRPAGRNKNKAVVCRRADTFLRYLPFLFGQHFRPVCF